MLQPLAKDGQSQYNTLNHTCTCMIPLSTHALPFWLMESANSIPNIALWRTPAVLPELFQCSFCLHYSYSSIFLGKRKIFRGCTRTHVHMERYVHLATWVQVQQVQVHAGMLNA